MRRFRQDGAGGIEGRPTDGHGQRHSPSRPLEHGAGAGDEEFCRKSTTAKPSRYTAGCDEAEERRGKEHRRPAATLAEGRRRRRLSTEIQPVQSRPVERQFMTTSRTATASNPVAAARRGMARRAHRDPDRSETRWRPRAASATPAPAGDMGGEGCGFAPKKMAVKPRGPAPPRGLAKDEERLSSRPRSG